MVGTPNAKTLYLQDPESERPLKCVSPSPHPRPDFVQRLLAFSSFRRKTDVTEAWKV